MYCTFLTGIKTELLYLLVISIDLGTCGNVTWRRELKICGIHNQI